MKVLAPKLALHAAVRGAAALLAAGGLSVWPAMVQAQTPAPSSPGASKAVPKKANAPAAPTGKPKAAAARPAGAGSGESASRVEARSTASQLAAGVIAAETALTPEELAISEQVHLGDHPCELGQTVQVRADDRLPGYFEVRVQRKRYRMYPVVSRTGAIRLEDRQGEALWLQLANKSMFIDRKMGRRMADECMSPAQVEVANALKANPQPGLLDVPAPAPAPTPTSTPTALPAPAQAPAATGAQDTPQKTD